MPITTLDQALAGMQWPRFFAKAATGTLVAGRPFSLWALAGFPGAGAYDATLNGVALTAPVNGQIPFSNPVSGNSYLARLQAANVQAGMLLLVDRLWHNGGFNITLTTAQNIVSPTWPARDADGATSGAGVLLSVDVSATTGAGTPTLTASYTNSAGTAGRTATNVLTTAASSAAGTSYWLGLQAGDLGVRSVESLTLSATWTSGTINMVAYRILAALELSAASVPNAIDALTSGFPRIYDGSVPYFIFLPSASTSSSFTGQVLWTRG
jgi:hypothetical protein